MLTIDRDQNFALKVHQREKFWNKTLIFSLGLALVLHFSAFVLFRVKPITLAKSKKILPLISVALESSGIERGEVAASIPEDPKPLYSLPARPKQKPGLPGLPLDNQTKFIGQESRLLTLQRKNSPYLPPPPEKNAPSVSIVLLGKLAHRTMTKALPSLKASSIKNSQYSVTVDDKTGSIIWISPADDLGLLISQIKLNQLPSQTLTKGILEVQVK